MCMSLESFTERIFILYKIPFISLIMKILKKPHARFEVMAVVLMKIDLCAIRPFSLVYWYQCFKGSYCLHLQASDYPACSSKFLVLVYMASYPRRWNLNGTCKNIKSSENTKFVL